MKNLRIRHPAFLRCVETLLCLALGLVACLSVSAATSVWDGGTGGGGTSWLTAGNWNPDAIPGTTDEAQIGSAGTANDIGINLGGSVNNGANNQAIGSITVLVANTRTRDIYNSSSSANGYLTLNGSSDILLANNSTKDLTIRNGTSRSMGLVLAASGEIAVNSSGNIIINSDISETGGSRSMTKTGSGTLALGGANTYSGGTTLTGGAITLGANNALGSGSFNFNGGTLNANNHSASIGALTLSTTSTLNLSSDSTHGSLTFSSASYTAGTLNIAGWTGTAGGAGTDDRLYITANPGLTFLENVHFTGFASGALWFSGTGEIAPVPEPIHYALAVFGLIFAGVRGGRYYAARRQAAR